jgi:hypothetical protein
MNVVTERDLIKTVAKRWRNRFYSYIDGWLHLEWLDTEKAYNELLKLPPNATGAQVEAITGSLSWTKITCDECGIPAELIVIIGEKPDMERSPAGVCIDCLEKAVDIAKSTKGGWPKIAEGKVATKGERDESFFD